MTGTSSNSFRHASREDDSTGVYYYRARYYSPKLQRFLSEDPIGLAGGINSFVYVGNNPIRYIDPSGLCRDPGGTGLRYCIGNFIPERKVWGIFDGDDRGPSPDSHSYRFEYLVNGSNKVEPSAGTTSVFGGWFPHQAVYTGSYSVQNRKLGGRKITLNLLVRNGIFGDLAPPAGYQMTIRENPDGTAEIVGWDASAYPSLEIWQYGGPAGVPNMLLHYDSTSAGTGPTDINTRIPIP